jgi:hypothetical protein
LAELFVHSSGVRLLSSGLRRHQSAANHLAYFDALSMTCAITDTRAAMPAISARTDCSCRSDPNVSRPSGRLRSKATRSASPLEANPAKIAIHEAAFLLTMIPMGANTSQSRVFSIACPAWSSAAPAWLRVACSRSHITDDAYVSLTSRSPSRPSSKVSHPGT